MKYVIKRLSEMSVNGHISLPAIRKINYPFYLYVRDNFEELKRQAEEYGVYLHRNRGDYELAKYLSKEVDEDGRLRRLRTVTCPHDRYLYRRIYQRASKYGMSMEEYINYLGFSYNLTKSIHELHQRGLSNTEIAKKLGCSRVTVWKKLKGKL